jgi:hypothetical protein
MAYHRVGYKVDRLYFCCELQENTQIMPFSFSLIVVQPVISLVLFGFIGANLLLFS